MPVTRSLDLDAQHDGTTDAVHSMVALARKRNLMSMFPPNILHDDGGEVVSGTPESDTASKAGEQDLLDAAKILAGIKIRHGPEASARQEFYEWEKKSKKSKKFKSTKISTSAQGLELARDQLNDHSLEYLPAGHSRRSASSISGTSTISATSTEPEEPSPSLRAPGLVLLAPKRRRDTATSEDYGPKPKKMNRAPSDVHALPPTSMVTRSSSRRSNGLDSGKRPRQ